MARSRGRLAASGSEVRRSRLMLEEARCGGREARLVSCWRLLPAPAVLRLAMLALSRAHSESSALLRAGATCRHRDEVAGGGAEDGGRSRRSSTRGCSGVLGLDAEAVNTEMAAARSGRDWLRFSREAAVSRVKLRSAWSSCVMGRDWV